MAKYTTRTMTKFQVMVPDSVGDLWEQLNEEAKDAGIRFDLSDDIERILKSALKGLRDEVAKRSAPGKKKAKMVEVVKDKSDHKSDQATMQA